MENNVVSIIIPCYNNNYTIGNTIESVINQSGINIEVILVNDGSRYDCLKILEEYAKKHNNIKIINQTNLGPGIARNNGITASKGKYILFIDSDDTIEPDCLKDLYEMSCYYNLDILDFNFNVKNGAQTFFIRDTIELINPCSGSDYLRQYIKQFSKLPFVSIWTHFFRRKFLLDNGIHFIESRLFEDFLFTIQAYLCASRVMYLNKSIYNYNPSVTSITRAKINPGKIKDCATVSIEISKIAVRTGIKLPMDKLFSGYKNSVIQCFENKLWKEYRIYFDRKLFRETKFYLYQTDNKIVYWFSQMNFSLFICFCRILYLIRSLRHILQKGEI